MSSVPLDYDNPSMGTANLSLAMMPHTKEPRLGTVFMNPGGPGGSGAEAVWVQGKPLIDYLGGQYDLVRTYCATRSASHSSGVGQL